MSAIRRLAYELTGRRPWSWGYLEARDREIEQALKATSAAGGFEPGPRYGRAMDERVVELPWFLEKLPKGTRDLLDAGSTLNQDLILRHLPLDRMRLVITTLAPEARSFPERGITYVYEDLRELTFPDASFDCVASLSTLEHVGMDNTRYAEGERFRERSRKDYLKALAQLRRVLRPGGTLLATVPYGRETDLGWFQQFGRGTLAELMAGFGPATMEVRFYRYRPEGWKQASQEECDDASYFDVRAARGLDPDRAAAARAVACLSFTSTHITR